MSKEAVLSANRATQEIMDADNSEPQFQITTEGIVWDVWDKGKYGIPLARVLVPMIHPQDMPDGNKDVLDWNAYEPATLNRGDRVEVAFFDSTLTKFKVTKLLRQHDKSEKGKGGSAKAGGASAGASAGGGGVTQTPNSVVSGPADGKSFRIENDLLKLDVPIHQLATAYLNRLVGTAFTKFNNNITKFITKGAGSMGCAQAQTPFGDTCLDPTDEDNWDPNPTCPSAQSCGMAICPPPIISCAGVPCSTSAPGCADLTKDMQRMCEPSAGGSDIGNINALVKINGACVDMADYSFVPDGG